MPVKRKITFVIPVLNEDENIATCINEIELFGKLHLNNHYDVEILVTDNNSSDRTSDIVKSLCSERPHLKYIRFSSNIGYQASILTGYLNAQGDAVVQYDCDMQDPIEVVAEFIALWKQGFKVVYGVRETRCENFAITFCRKAFYRVINSLSTTSLPLDAGDFRLIDHEVCKQLHQLKDPAPYLRGIIANLGFRQTGVRYARRARTKGESKFAAGALVRLAVDGIVNHSLFPLRIATWLGLLSTVVFSLLIGAYFVTSIAVGTAWPAGFTTLVLLILFQLSITSLLLGILGEYVGRILRTLKPVNIVACEEAKNISVAEIVLP